MRLALLRPALALLAGCLSGAFPLAAQSAAPLATDYSESPRAFPLLNRPYLAHEIPEPDLRNAADLTLTVQDGTLRLTLAKVIAAVVENNLAVAAARYYPRIAQTELLRARSGASPRGVDASVVPSGVFAGAEGGSILGTAGGGGGGSSNPGGITGAAGRVSVRPSGLFDPTVSLAFSMDRTSSPLNTEVVAGIPSVNTKTAAFSAGYVQAFSTGTSVTASYGFQRQGSNQLHLVFNPDFTPGFTATLSQQLLNGFGKAVNLALVKVAENEQKIEREAFRQQATTALVAAQNAYWDLAAAQEGVRAAQQALDAAEELASESQAQVRVGTMAPLDVASAQSQAAAARRDLVAAQTTSENAELQLKALMFKALEEPLASARIETADAFPDPAGAPIPTFDDAAAKAKANRPDLAVAQGNIKSQQDVLPFIRNALLPNLNAFVLVTTVGLYNVFGTSFSEAIHFRYPEYAFGLSLSFPIRNRQAQADDLRSRLELRQAQDTLARSQSQVEVDVQNALIALRNSTAQVAAADVALRLEREKLDAEEKKRTAGLSTDYNVILVQRDLLAAQLAAVQARDTYAKARVGLDQAMGVTLENCNVRLDDVLQGIGRKP
jgi:outer membrane protein TolC